MRMQFKKRIFGPLSVDLREYKVSNLWGKKRDLWGRERQLQVKILYTKPYNTSPAVLLAQYARSLQHSSTPGDPCRGSKTSHADLNVETACRPIKDSDYFQEYGCDDAKLKSVSAQAMRRKSEEHQSVYGSEFQNYARKNKAMMVDDVNQITDQARVASKMASEYYSRLQRFGLNEVGMRMTEDETRGTRS
ncbi:hypothetical protein AXG93_4509s1070 [Marchantia polymorpha subsp. ruderalis]|uniref:Uncharacterized protein n=1 Tax=Marchantia polymorpha subsp. ruderalis TaxID=1480154 RepID=A0A176WLK9_MARPO|nr:hypothetical protein AXG93_4509s1070 [Marchantia polymorpha subsp. ruderalis]